MSYIRALHRGLGLYIYPEDNGIRFASFPESTTTWFPDEMLDILLANMDNEELQQRKKHGDVLMDILEKKNNKLWEENKNFWKEDGKWQNL